MDSPRLNDVEIANGYRVEVSGWDAAENFFVEKTMLCWSRDTTREVSLRSPVREGCIVFVRLLQRSVHSDTIPVAYRVAELAAKDGNGCAIARLVQLYPRVGIRHAGECLKIQ